MKISIITATYNSACTIRQTIISVNEQTYPDVEHIVVDGVSKDETLEIIYSLPNRVSKMVSEPDKGIYDALNKGIKLAEGDIIGLLHSDDSFASDQTLEIIAQTFQDPNIDLVYGDLQYIDIQQKIIRNWKSCTFTPGLLCKGWMPPHPTVFMKREVYEKHKYFNLTYRIAADYDHMLRVFQDQSLNFRYLPEVITKMRVGGVSNRNLKNILIKSLEDYQVIRTHKMSNPFWVLFQKNFTKLTQLRKIV